MQASPLPHDASRIPELTCDETRPACQRCTRFGRVCDGYDVDRPKQDAPAVTSSFVKYRPLLKKPVALITKQPAAQVYGNNDEFQSFRLYCEDVAPRLAGEMQAQLWSRLLLQASQDQPYIRNAIFAIGALSKTHRGGGVGAYRYKTIGTGDTELALQQYHSFALQHYDKFLRGVRENITDDEAGRRMAMIACILVVCIETLQNHSQAAFFHSRAGIDLMHDWLSRRPTPASEIREGGGAQPNGRKLLPGIASPAPQIVEDELVQQFSRMEIQHLVQFDLRTPERHARLKHEGSTSIKLMPTEFTNTQEAMHFMDLIRRRTYHFMSEILLNQYSTARRRDSLVNFRDHEVYQRDEIINFSFQRVIVPEEIQVEREMYASENRRWAQAFEPLYRSIDTGGSHREKIRAKLLKIHSLALPVRLAGHLAASELIYDQYLPEFRQMLALGEAVLDHPDLFVEGSFSFDMGITYDFSTIGMSCRDRTLRRRALALLNRKSWREGPFGSKTVADMATCIMEIEEKAADTEYIPEQARVKLTNINVDVAKRNVTLTLLQGSGENARMITALRDWSEMY
ncbi:hypothetical protein BP6252_09744 [Coleophoma cylindrospora]|uniref:Zn(2)-C6 fungal-type domain-containing protein n=1 Tax=Coleophoma cylindrospora TaxID=1849047 RepID=A0A3D8QWH4_9HELO|nr:hypothetical protein BP6252_09744 [Coleophoma cylindrospora]